MENKETREILREVHFDVEMPTEISIGDPLYFEEGEKEFVYDKKYRGKKTWVGNIRLREEEVTCDFDGKPLKIIDINASIIFAPTPKMLELYNRGKVYAAQKCKDTEIGVDSASYEFCTNNGYEKIHTGADGFWGSVTEVYTGSKLEGILIDIGFPDLMTYEEVEQALKRLFKEVITESN